MIYRQNDGSLIEIKKNDFKNDILFYKKILAVKNKNKQETIQTCFINKNYSKTTTKKHTIEAIQNLL